MAASAVKEKKPVNPHFKFFNFKRVSDITGIDRDKLYNTINRVYDSWTAEDKKKIADSLKPAVKSVFEELGYDVSFSKIK